MNLVKFLFLGSLISLIFGEFFHLPFGVSSGAIYFTDVLLVLSLMSFFIWKISQKEKFLTPSSYQILWPFYLVCLVSIFLSLFLFFPPEVLKGSLYFWRFILYSSSLFLIFNLKKEGLITIIGFLGILKKVVISLSVLGFIQLIVYPDFNIPEYSLTQFGFDPHVSRLTSTFLDPNFLGVFLTFCLGILLASRLISLKEVLIIVGAIILTYSRSAYLYLVIIAFFWVSSFWSNYSLENKLRGLVVFFLVGSLVMILNPKILERVSGGILIDASSRERLISWQNGLEIFGLHKIIGVGFNNLRTIEIELNNIKEYSIDGGHAGAGIDSSFLTVLATTGILGFLTFCYFWIKVFARIKNKLILGTFLGLIISCQFINGLFYPPLMLVYFSCLGLFVD